MGYKNVGINCKRVESLGTDLSTFRTGNCPQSSAPMYFVNQKFRPPKVTDEKSWAVAAYLISNGFAYYTIRDKSGVPVNYPTTIQNNLWKTIALRLSSGTHDKNMKSKNELPSCISDRNTIPEIG